MITVSFGFRVQGLGFDYSDCGDCELVSGELTQQESGSSISSEFRT